MAQVAFTTGPNGLPLDISDLSAPIIGTHNSYLDETTQKIRATQIPWDGYAQANLITPQELQTMKSFNPSSLTPESAATLLELIGKIARTDTLQWLLVTVDDLAGSKKNADVFNSLQAQNPSLPLTPLLKQLSSGDEFVQYKAAKAATSLISAMEKAPSTDLTPLWDWASDQLSKGSPQTQDLVLQFIGAALAPVPVRTSFYTHPTAANSVLKVLSTGPANAQTQYQAIYIFWLLSFVPEIAGDLNQRLNIIPTFMDISKAAIKEKVVRIVVGTFRNMATRAPEKTVIPMVGAKMVPYVDTLSGRKWTDSEIQEDLDYLKQTLGNSVTNLTTWDEYASEVKSGRLTWSPTHQSDAFWKLSITKFNDKDKETVRDLARLLTTSQDPTTLAVACNDIGQYVKFYPQGKRFVEQIGAKTKIMELMSHENPEVRYNALVATQKMMVNAWA